MASTIKEYTIPLGVLRKHPETKRANRSIKVIQRFVFKHLRKKPDFIRIEPEVNETLWERGKYAVPKRIDVSILLEGDMARVFLKGSKKIKQRLDDQKEKKKDEKKEDKAKEKEEKDEKSEEELKKEADQKKSEEKIKKRAQHAELKGK